MREKWSSRTTFILGAVGSAVGLGNAWRFPGLASKYGGGTFLLVYLVALLLIGIPLLMAEIAIGRKAMQGAPGSMRAINKKAEWIGWIGVGNGLTISIYYAVVFAWVILMFFLSFKFAGLTGNPEGASALWATTIKNSWVTGFTEGANSLIVWPVLICLILAWGSCWYCIRNGTSSVSKVVKYTVFLPLLCLLILAVRGFTLPNAMTGIAKLFTPDFSALAQPTLWVDAFGQVFYSMSCAMAIMFAYGSFLKKESNIALDATIIAACDFGVSLLSSIVMFTTMAGVGMLDSMTASGIGTAFLVYPMAIVSLSSIPWVNAAFAYVFYFCLITLAIDSLFSIVEGTSTAFSDKFHWDKRKTTTLFCIAEFVIGLVYVNSAGMSFLDIADYYINAYPILVGGALEAFAIGWMTDPNKVLYQINRNTTGYKIPAWWFNNSLRFATPLVLVAMLIWNIIQTKFLYGIADGYSVLANAIFGWLVVAVALFMGFFVKMIVKYKAKKGFIEDEIIWDQLSDTQN